MEKQLAAYVTLLFCTPDCTSKPRKHTGDTNMTASSGHKNVFTSRKHTPTVCALRCSVCNDMVRNPRATANETLGISMALHAVFTSASTAVATCLTQLGTFSMLTTT